MTEEERECAADLMWADDRRAGEERITEEEWMTQEEQECAADLMWAERAFKTRRGFQEGKPFKDRPRQHQDSRQEPDEEVSPM